MDLKNPMNSSEVIVGDPVREKIPHSLASCSHSIIDVIDAFYARQRALVPRHAILAITDDRPVSTNP